MGLFTTEEKIDYLILLHEELNQKLDLVISSQVQPHPDKYGVKQIAAYIGYSTTYVYRFIESGLLKSFSNGEKSHVWTTKAEMDRFIIEDLPNYPFGKSDNLKKAQSLTERKKKVAKTAQAA